VFGESKMIKLNEALDQFVSSRNWWTLYNWFYRISTFRM